MKISIKKNNFLNSLNIVKSALPNNTTFPIFECILIDASKKNINLYSTNTEMSIKADLEGEIIEKGKIAIEGNFLISIISTMPNNDDDIIITSDENFNCIISCGRIEEKFKGKNYEDFPNLSNYSKEKYIKITEYLLKKMIEKTIVAVSKNRKEKNLLIKGTNIEVENDNILFRSMDNYRIAIIKQKLKEKYEKMSSLVPGTTLEEVLKIIKGDINKEVIMYFNDNLIVFEFENSILISSLINAKSINIDRLINNEYKTRVVIDKKNLCESINRTKNYINRIEEKPVLFNIKEDKLVVNLQSINGDYREEIPIKLNGKELMIGFIQDQIYSILSVIDDDEITLYFNSSQDPLIIKDKNENYIYLILSVSINLK